LRKVISQVATNLGNGSAISEKASIEFIEELPKEVLLVIDGNKREHDLTKIQLRELHKNIKKVTDAFEKYLD
jgi:carbonic anhydrase/acetyltransferase-like protein (isoleucine patch superfamily)